MSHCIYADIDYCCCVNLFSFFLLSGPKEWYGSKTLGLCRFNVWAIYLAHVLYEKKNEMPPTFWIQSFNIKCLVDHKVKGYSRGIGLRLKVDEDIFKRILKLF